MHYFLFFIVGFLFIKEAQCLKETLEIENDKRSAFHVESFGYKEGGKFLMTVENFQLLIRSDYEKPETYNIAFVLQRSNSDGGVRVDDSADSCFHETSTTEDDVLIHLDQRSTWTHLEFDTTIQEPGYYHLYFSNCEFTTHASFTLHLTEYNFDNGVEDYLSVGESQLPSMIGGLTAAFFLLMLVWLKVVWSERENVKAIHHLMTVVLALKILSLFFEAVKFHALKTEGTHDKWVVLYYIFTGLKGMMMFAVIVLIGTGWSYLKPFLTDRDKQIMLAVLQVQLMVNIAMVVLDEMPPGSASWLTWRDVLHLLDILCCCFILFPIVASIRHLRSAANADGKMARNLQRLKSFRMFYLIVVGYVYFTRIIVFLLGATLPYDLAWMSTVFSEIAAFCFYAITGKIFRPQSKHPYLAAVTSDSESDESISLQPLNP